MIAAVERGFPQSEIADASYRYQHSIETGEQTVVGVNSFQENTEEQQIEVLRMNEASADLQTEKLRRLRTRRDNGRVATCLRALRSGASAQENTMPYILDAVRAYATLGEICDALREVFGTYQERGIL
jgi:methylmalonyl-CoA mutase, N-terminal domain